MESMIGDFLDAICARVDEAEGCSSHCFFVGSFRWICHIEHRHHTVCCDRRRAWRRSPGVTRAGPMAFEDRPPYLPGAPAFEVSDGLRGERPHERVHAAEADVSPRRSWTPSVQTIFDNHPWLPEVDPLRNVLADIQLTFTIEISLLAPHCCFIRFYER